MSLGRMFKLNTGASIPAVGLGTWQAQPGEVGRAVKTALTAGYRHLDLAHVYCNEKEIGAALKEWFKSNPNVKRDQIFITSKLWNTYHRPSDVKSGLETTLSDLGIDYLDLYLIHWPFAFTPNAAKDLSPVDAENNIMHENDKCSLEDTYKAMEKLLDTGKVKAIGVSNFSIATLKALLPKIKVVPAVNQMELHPYLPQLDLIKYCQEQGIHLTAYSPLGSSKLDPPLRDDSIIKKIAEKRNKSPAQVLISWAVQRGTSVIPKSVNDDRIKANFVDFELDAHEMEEIAKLGSRNIRTCDPVKFWNLNCFDESRPML